MSKEIFLGSVKGVVDFTKHGKCSRCQQCCSDILPLTVDEIRAMANYALEHKVKPKPRVRHFPALQLDMRCCFIDDETKSCMIYPARPEICKLFQCNQTQETIDMQKLQMSMRPGNIHVSTHVTFLREPNFINYIRSNTYLSTMLKDVRIEPILTK